MQFEPLHDRVLVRRDAAETQSESGIVFAPSAKEKPNQGVVLAVGPGKQVGNKFVETTVSAGDIVIFGKGAGIAVKLNDEELFMLTEDDIYGIIRE